MLAEGIAGISAGAANTVLLHPLDLLKIRYQLGLNDGVLSIYKTHGVAKGLYRGLSANLFGNASSWGLYFFFYKLYKDTLKGFSARHYGVEDARSHGDGNVLLNFGAAALAGTTGLVISNPIWVIKTHFCKDLHQQTDLRQIVSRIILDKGLGGFYRGILPGAFGVLQSTIQMTLYETIKARYKPENPLDYVLASSSSKIAAILVTYPYQVVRSRIQVSSSTQSLRDVVREVVREKAFYRGIVPAGLRVLPGTAVTFVTYETVLKLLAT